MYTIFCFASTQRRQECQIQRVHSKSAPVDVILWKTTDIACHFEAAQPDNSHDRIDIAPTQSHLLTALDSELALVRPPNKHAAHTTFRSLVEAIVECGPRAFFPQTSSKVSRSGPKALIEYWSARASVSIDPSHFANYVSFTQQDIPFMKTLWV